MVPGSGNSWKRWDGRAVRPDEREQPGGLHPRDSGRLACYRVPSYVYPNTPGLTNTAAANYTSQGFEVGVHETTNCGNFTPASLANNYANDIASWQGNYPSLKTTPPVSNRAHCIAYSDWSSQPKTELANGMRLDGNYYYWPGSSAIQDRPGLMTGSRTRCGSPTPMER